MLQKLPNATRSSRALVLGCLREIDHTRGIAFPITLLCLFLYSDAAQAATVAAASCSSSAVQAAINSASNGDTVQVPGPCSVSWPSGVTISGKGITLNGGGATVTGHSASPASITISTN